MEEFNIAEEAFQDKMGDKPFLTLNKPATSQNTSTRSFQNSMRSIVPTPSRPNKSMSESNGTSGTNAFEWIVLKSSKGQST